MLPCDFQEILHSKHIIITNWNLQFVSCDCRGLMALNSMKELIVLEGILLVYSQNIFLLINPHDQSNTETSELKEGVLKQFIDNLDFENPNILQVV